jgi:hypothetical protein
MGEEKEAPIVPVEMATGPTKELVCVKVWLNAKEFADAARDAEKAGKRVQGLKLFKQKPHGFPGEILANTKGISIFLKDVCWKEWQGRDEERAKDKQHLLEQAAKLGLKVSE